MLYQVDDTDKSYDNTNPCLEDFRPFVTQASIYNDIS